MLLSPLHHLFSLILALTTAVTLVNSVSLTISPLAQCEPADFVVQAKGNYTIDLRDASKMYIMFRFKFQASDTTFTWPAVQLTSGSTAIITITDRIGPGREDVEQRIYTKVVGASPRNDSLCIRRERDRENNRAHGIEIPLVAGILGGILLILVALIFLTMLRRRSERNSIPDKDDERGNTSVAGSGYMAKLVPGLQISPPQQAQAQTQRPRRQRRRRGFITYRRREDDELPSYGDSQHLPPKYDHEHENEHDNANEIEAFELPQRWTDPEASSSTTRLFVDADRIEPIHDHHPPNRI